MVYLLPSTGSEECAVVTSHNCHDHDNSDSTFSREVNELSGSYKLDSNNNSSDSNVNDPIDTSDQHGDVVIPSETLDLDDPPVISNTTEFNVTVSEVALRDYVLQEVKTKLEYGSSQSEIEAHLANASSLLGNDLIPSKWQLVLKLLKNLGYWDPKHYKVCCESDHSQLLDNGSSNCSKCGRSYNDCIDYYVLGLNFDTWFVSPQMCNQLLSHWEDRGEWFNVNPDDDINLIEIWHGSRFRELSYFWDPNKITMLPCHCPNCKNIVKADLIKSGKMPSPYFNQVSVKCPHCKKMFLICPREMKGDPRNQAILIHIDGWNPQSTSAKHSIAAITISHGTMRKANRADGKNTRIYSFIPTHQLPQKSPHKFDAFLEPLLKEIENLYINGMEVFFSKSVEGYSPPNDNALLRVVPLLFAGDMIAHSEIGLVTHSGYKGCRRCYVTGTYYANSCRFGQFQQRYRFPAKSRDAQSNRNHGKDVDKEMNQSRKKALIKKTGVTGETILYRLYDLCGFDPVYDLVIDAMHCLCLNLIHNELGGHILREMGNNKHLSPSDRNAKEGGVLSKKDLSGALEKVQWTSEMKNGRVPSIYISSKTNVGYWKAEDFSKFALVAPYILRELVSPEVYDCFCLLSDIRNLIFCHTLRINGWRKHHILTLESLLWKHAILFESIYGLQACTPNLEYSIHMADDVARHSTLDNYWCYVYERLVSFHKDQTTNQKQLCKTLADRIHQLDFVNLYFSKRALFQPSSEQINPFEEILVSDKPFTLHAQTVSLGMQLKDFISSLPSLPQSIEFQYNSGILIGKGESFLLSSVQKNDIAFWVNFFTGDIISSENLSLGAFSFKKLLKSNECHEGTVFRVGEMIALEDHANSSLEWVVKLSHILSVGPYKNRYYTFINGDYYKAKTRNGDVQIDDWTGQPMLIPYTYTHLCLQPTSLIKRKLMLHDCSPCQSTPSVYLAVNIDIFDESKSLDVPTYPKVGEIVRSNCGSSKVVIIKVQEVHCEDSSFVVGNPLKKINATLRLWREQTSSISVPLTSIMDVITFNNTRKTNEYILECS